MKHKLQRIKEESKQLCGEISRDLMNTRRDLDKVAQDYSNKNKEGKKQ